MRFIALTFLLIAVASACTNYKTTAALNLRKGAGTGYAVVKSAVKGTTLCVVSISGGWAKLSDGNYASSQYLTKVESATPSCTNYVTTSVLNVRKGAGTGYAIVRSAAKGSTVCVVSIANGWAKLSDGYYVSSQYLTKSGSTTTTTPTTTTPSTGSSSSSSSASASSSKISITQKSSPNRSSRGGQKPDVIVCHITEGGYSGAVSWLCNSSSKVSCHYVVSKKGEISQLVPITYASWCHGAKNKATATLVKNRSASPNSYMIGIEHEGFHKDCKGCLTDAQKQASGKLIKHIVNEVKSTFGVTIPIDRDHIIGHYEINPINKPNCPGQNFPWADVIAIAKSA